MGEMVYFLESNTVFLAQAIDFHSKGRIQERKRPSNITGRKS